MKFFCSRATLFQKVLRRQEIQQSHLRNAREFRRGHEASSLKIATLEKTRQSEPAAFRQSHAPGTFILFVTGRSLRPRGHPLRGGHAQLVERLLQDFAGGGRRDRAAEVLGADARFIDGHQHQHPRRMSRGSA